MPKKKRVYNTRKKRVARLQQMMFCDRCGHPFVPDRKWDYVCLMCRSVDPRKQNGR